MGKSILKAIGVVFGVILFPCLLTMILSGSYSVPVDRETSLSIGETSYETLKGVGDQTVDQYVTSVLAVYAPLKLEMETMKAQAIIIRTYVYYKWQELLTTGKPGTDFTIEYIGLPTTTLDSITQKFGEKEGAAMISSLENVVYSTRDTIITYDNNPILACYHYANAGKTRDYKENTGIHLPYLSSVDSRQDIEASVGISSLQILFEDAANILMHTFEIKGLDPENLMEQIKITATDSNGYVKEVKVGEKTISGKEIQDCFDLNSTNFYFTQYEGNLRIICRGKGSGYGFSQYGANEMALQGKSCEELLSYYYPGTTLFSLEKKAP